MLKKIIIWTIYAGVVGLLIFGAVIRTEAKTGLSILQPVTNLEFSRYSQEGEETSVNDEGYGRNSSPSGAGEQLLQAENEDHDWTDLAGIVASLETESLWIETLDGELLEITGRAWRFILESGFQISAGDQVSLEGFFENGEFEVSEIINLTTEVFLQVRDENGRPLWSGGAAR